MTEVRETQPNYHETVLITSLPYQMKWVLIPTVHWNHLGSFQIPVQPPSQADSLLISACGAWASVIL